MTDDATTQRLIPLDDVDPRDPEARRQYLLNCGWEADGQKLRWKGHGKRTLGEALSEQRDREIENLATTVPTTSDELLVRRCARSKTERLVKAAATNPLMTAELLQELLVAGYLEAVAGSPAITEQLARAVLVADQQKRSPWNRRVEEALLRQPHLPFQLKRELIEPWLQREVLGTLRWEGTPLMAAAEGADTTLLQFICDTAVHRFNTTPVHALDDRRDCEAVLVALAENERCPPQVFDALAAMDYEKLDSSLVKNPALPLRLYQRLAPLTAERDLGELRLCVIAVGLNGRRLWLDEYSASTDGFRLKPEGMYMRIAEMPDGDLFVSRRDGLQRAGEILGTLLWVPVHWPDSPRELYYRGFSRGLTDYESSRFLRESGAELINAWPEIRKLFVRTRPEMPVHVARYQAAEALERAKVARQEVLLEAIENGIPELKLSRILGVRDAHLRKELEAAKRARAEREERRISQAWRTPDAVGETKPSKLTWAMTDMFGDPRVELRFASEADDERAEGEGPAEDNTSAE